MKKYILTIVMAILVGVVFGLWYFKDVKEEVASALSISSTANAFQVGVYQKYENAVKEKEKYDYAIIIPDGEFFRVYIGLSKEGEATEFLKNYFDSKGYLYYLKQIVIPDAFSDDFNNYQEVLMNAEEIDLMNKKILEEYSKSLNGVYD
ncbi:MAG: hypothetical protein ACI31M_00135 [Bacilli bacterium]